MENIATETIYSKYEFSGEELLKLSRQMARAEQIISDKADALKSVTTQIKAEIAAQEEIMHSCAEKVRSGYEMHPHQCEIKYILESGMAQYVDIDSGEIIQERTMTKDEQLKLA